MRPREEGREGAQETRPSGGWVELTVRLLARMDSSVSSNMLRSGEGSSAFGAFGRKRIKSWRRKRKAEVEAVGRR